MSPIQIIILCILFGISVPFVFVLFIWAVILRICEWAEEKENEKMDKK